MPSSIDNLYLVTLLTAIATVSAAGSSTNTDEKLDYNRDVRPILSDNCFHCHGPDKATRKADLRLDLREPAMASEVLSPGDPEKSELVYRTTTDDDADIMPPPKEHKQLSDAEKKILTQWIKEGAEYQPHWAYLTPKKSPLPVTIQNDRIRTPIDAFVAARLDQEKLRFSSEAEKRTLLRRLSFDLTGLPPTPSEIVDFLEDTSPDAYRKQVDRLLASPRYGERMAVPWLDVVRYADSAGYHGDQVQRIFPYRDYVINAFNKNKPYDAFVTEQIAGDLLPNATLEQKVATGFNRLNMMTREGGAQPKEYLAKYAADRVRAVSTAFLGSTMGCAECHDHKFDPFTAKDFYGLAAFFADVKQWGVYSKHFRKSIPPELRGITNDHPFPPEIQVESPYHKRRMNTLTREAESIALDAVAAAPDKFGLWLSEMRTFLAANPSGWQTLTPVAPTAEKDASLIFPAVTIEKGSEKQREEAKKKPRTATVAIKGGTLAALRLELLPSATHNNKISSDGNPLSVWLTAHLIDADGKKKKLSFYHAVADKKKPDYKNSELLASVHQLWKTPDEGLESPHTATYLLDKPLTIPSDATLSLQIRPATIGSIRLSASPIGQPLAKDPGDFKNFATTVTANTPASAAEDSAVQIAYLWSNGAPDSYRKKIRHLASEISRCHDGKAWSMVTEAVDPRELRLLPRGNWQDDSGEVVQPSPPEFLVSETSPPKDRLSRLDLARWIVHPDNPLSSRTFVNRLWRQFFGTGISAVLDDLGNQGDWPSHPELLDWLAVEFVESGWDVKHIVRLIVESTTYRQSSDAPKALVDSDPHNRLLARQAPRRLDAEFVRDNALAIADLLDQNIGGPSTRPYQPAGYYEHLNFPKRTYQAHRDDRQFRRGLYTHWQRTFLHPMMANFDASAREECTAERSLSNTPQQALTLLNDPSFVEAAHALATRILAATHSDDEWDDRDRLNQAFALALSRSPSKTETASLLKFAATQRDHYQKNPDEAKKLIATGISASPPNSKKAITELAAWTSVGRVILNLHETITIY